MLSGVIPERTVRFRLRTVLSLLAIIIGVAVTLEVIWIARHVLTWVVISVFLALALNPLVGWLQRRGLKRRGAAAAAAYLLAIVFIVAISFTFVPTLSSIHMRAPPAPQQNDVSRRRGISVSRTPGTPAKISRGGVKTRLCRPR